MATGSTIDMSTPVSVDMEFIDLCPKTNQPVIKFPCPDEGGEGVAIGFSLDELAMVRDWADRVLKANGR